MSSWLNHGSSNDSNANANAPEQQPRRYRPISEANQVATSSMRRDGH
jgi:hypothetical protein